MFAPPALMTCGGGEAAPVIGGQAGGGEVMAYMWVMMARTGCTVAISSAIALPSGGAAASSAVPMVVDVSASAAICRRRQVGCGGGRRPQAVRC